MRAVVLGSGWGGAVEVLGGNDDTAVAMGDLAAEIAGQCGVSPALVTYAPDAALEAAFAAQPPLVTPAAGHAGFAHDGNLATLVSSALSTIAATTERN